MPTSQEYNQHVINVQEWYRKQCKPISPLFMEKETNKMNVQEKDCRRCEKLNEEGMCPGIIEGAGSFKPDFATGCNVNFTPISGRDCRNCERFNGKGQPCTTGLSAHNFEAACSNFTPISTSKPSPTIHIYNEETRVIKGDKVLSLANIWSERPCGEEYREMSVRFTKLGFNPDEEIPFTHKNLNLLSNIAFSWLLEEDFFIKAEEEKVVYETGQWFSRSHTSSKYLTINAGLDSYMLIHIVRRAGICKDGERKTMKELSDMIHKSWYDLTPIDSPLES